MNIDEYRALPLEERRMILKELVAQTVPRGEIKEAAYAAGLSPSIVYKARDPECEMHNLIRPEILDLIHHTGRFLLLDFIDGLFGRIGFTLPQAITSLPEINRQITAVLRETSEAIQAVIGAVDESSPASIAITAEEVTRIEQEVLEAHQHLAAMAAAVRALYQGKSGGSEPRGPEVPLGCCK